MATDMFLKMQPLKGESQAKDHKGEIEIHSWHWGVSQDGTTHIGTGGGSGKVSVQDATFTHFIDCASTGLLQACTTGKHFDEALLTCRKAGGDNPVEYLKIKFTNVIVSNVMSGGSSHEERVSENFTLNFQKFEHIYSQQDAKGVGSPGTPFKWDITGTQS
jgi:type VI secretion system secreted protein Hcp